MIAKATAIQHGQAMTNYATKNNRADLVSTNHLSEGLPPMGMWDDMVLHQAMFKQRYARKPIELTSIRFEISPSMEEARNWTRDDWSSFLEEFIKEIDNISEVSHIGRRKGKEASKVKPTNIANSQYFAALHHDSKSGIPRRRGNSPWMPPRLTKYLSATEHEELQVIDSMYLSAQSFDF